MGSSTWQPDGVSIRSLLTPKELADYLAVPLATVYKWNHVGSGPQAIRVGKHIRYRRADVDRWLEHREVAKR